MPSGMSAPTARRGAQRKTDAVEAPLALHDVLVVAREQLVAAVAGEHDLDVLGRQLRHHEGRNRRRVAERLVEVPGKVLDDPAPRPASGPRSWWSVPKRPPDRAGSSSSKADSAKPIEKVLTGGLRTSRHQRHHRARVDPAAQERADRHVADQVQRTDSSSSSRSSLDELASAVLSFGANCRSQYFSIAGAAAARRDEPCGRLELRDPATMLAADGVDRNVNRCAARPVDARRTRAAAGSA